MVSGVVVAALAGATGGGVGAALGGLIDKSRGSTKAAADGKGKRTWAGTLGVIGAVAGAQIGVHVLTPMMQPSVETQISSASREFRVLRDHYPDQFRQVVDVMKANPNASSAEMRSSVGPVISGLMEQDAPKMNDKSASELYGLTVDEAELLSRADPQSCVALLNSRTPRTPLDRVLTPELKVRDEEVSADVLEQAAVAPATPAPPLNADQSKALAIAAAKGLTPEEKKFVASVSKNLAAPMSDSQARVACKFTASLIRAAIAAPAGTLRSLASTK